MDNIDQYKLFPSVMEARKESLKAQNIQLKLKIKQDTEDKSLFDSINELQHVEQMGTWDKKIRILQHQMIKLLMSERCKSH